MPLGNSAGLATSHPLLGTGVVSVVIVAVNADIPGNELINSPTAVQLPGDAHDTELKYADGEAFWIPLANAAGCASSQTPFVDVMVNASFSSEEFLKYPTAVQLPGVAHDTESKESSAIADRTPEENSDGRAKLHTPFANDMVNASSRSEVFLNRPTAVQCPGDAHDTELKCAEGEADRTPVGNTAGCASSQTPFVDVMVNASSRSEVFLNRPTTVQLPGDAHDTDLNADSVNTDWTPSGNTAGCASSQTPFVDVIVNA
jgi:hypothetical protein